MKTLSMIWLLASSFMLPASARADDDVPTRISVMTMGPGDHAFARFGHNAILVEWPEKRPAQVFNYGTFAFDGIEGVREFMAGRLRYWLSVSGLSYTVQVYAAENRTLVLQDLDLTEDERRELGKALLLNARPQNRFYDYDYYYDNCSTRVRDIVDKVLGGEMERAARGQPGRLSFREHTLRLTAEPLWLSLGLDLALGPRTDRPTTRWEELFIPSELHDELARLQRRVDGRTVPVVSNESVILAAQREPIRQDPPGRVIWSLVVGLTLGAGFAGLGRMATTRAWARVVFATLFTAVCLVLGLLGTVMFVFWAFSKHWSAYANVNMLVCPPLALALLVMGIRMARGRLQGSQPSLRLLALCAMAALVALILAVLPNVGQDNTRIAPLLAPLWLGLYAGSSWIFQEPLWPLSRFFKY